MDYRRVDSHTCNTRLAANKTVGHLSEGLATRQKDIAGSRAGPEISTIEANSHDCNGSPTNITQSQCQASKGATRCLTRPPAYRFEPNLWLFLFWCATYWSLISFVLTRLISQLILQLILHQIDLA